MEHISAQKQWIHEFFAMTEFCGKVWLCLPQTEGMQFGVKAAGKRKRRRNARGPLLPTLSAELGPL